MFALSAPWILLLLPAPLLLWFLLPPLTMPRQATLHLPFIPYMRTILRGKTFLAHNNISSLILAWSIWILLIIAASGPQWLGKPLPIARAGRNIMLAVDISSSMQMLDMYQQQQPISRLQALQTVAINFINHRHGDRLGLILFGSKAYLQTPLTFDRHTVAAMLADSSVGLAGDLTALGDAIALGVKHLKDLPINNRVLIVLTDGAADSGMFNPIEAARLARKYNIKIYTIGFGATNLVSSKISVSQKNNSTVMLDETTLRTIANITHGHYFYAKNITDLQQIYGNINKLEPLNQDKITYRLQQSLYYWPLAAAWVLIMIILTRRALGSVLAAMTKTVDN